MKFSVMALAVTLTACAQAGVTRDAVSQRDPASAKNIIIVHGAFADGSGWAGVYRILTNDGYHVTLVQNPLVSLAADVTATQNALAGQNGPVVLVGHSYGGAVITQAGNDPKVKSLVYVAAYVPDEGESVGDLLAQADKGVPAPHIIINQKKGFAFVDPAEFPEEFAADIDHGDAKLMAATQRPLGLAAVGTKITKAAWKNKPSYYIVAGEDHMIPPADERRFAKKANAVQLFELKASHAVFISHPDDVAKIIENAASK